MTNVFIITVAAFVILALVAWGIFNNIIFRIGEVENEVGFLKNQYSELHMQMHGPLPPHDPRGTEEELQEEGNTRPAAQAPARPTRKAALTAADRARIKDEMSSLNKTDEFLD